MKNMMILGTQMRPPRIGDMLRKTFFSSLNDNGYWILVTELAPRVFPLTPAIGAVVEGVNLEDSLAASEVRELHRGPAVRGTSGAVFSEQFRES